MANDALIGVWSERVVTQDGVRPACLLFENEHIVAIENKVPEELAEKVESLDSLVLMPGLVDTHVHINEPGRTEWEGFRTATEAAAAGGITTLIDMPLNCLPVTTSAEALAEKLQAVGEQLSVNCGFWGGVTSENLQQLPELLKAGVFGVKSFLIDSGIPEFPQVDWCHVEEAMPVLKDAGLPYLFHAEWDMPEAVDVAAVKSYEDFVRSRPAVWEETAIAGVIARAKASGCHAHIVHLSAASALPMIAQAKNEGVPLTVETCPHYLTFSSQGVDAQELMPRSLFKCCPPIRDEENRERLWEAVESGLIDAVVSDHSPCTPALKRLEEDDLAGAWGGIAGLQLTLPLMWSRLQRNHDFSKLVQYVTTGPAQLMGEWGKSRQCIAVGQRADLVAWDPDARFQVDPSLLRHRHDISPYAGMELTGVVKKTFLGGDCVFSNGAALGEPRGKAILR